MDTVLESDGHGQNMPKDLHLGKKVMDVLEKYYAGHDWFINTCHEAGTVTIQLMYQGHDLERRIWKYGMVIHIPKLVQLAGDHFDHKIKMTGGELLERYNMARNAVSENSLVDFYRHGVDVGSQVL